MIRDLLIMFLNAIYLHRKKEKCKQNIQKNYV